MKIIRNYKQKDWYQLFVDENGKLPIRHCSSFGHYGHHSCQSLSASPDWGKIVIRKIQTSLKVFCKDCGDVFYNGQCLVPESVAEIMSYQNPRKVDNVCEQCMGFPNKVDLCGLCSGTGLDANLQYKTALVRITKVEEEQVPKWKPELGSDETTTGYKIYTNDGFIVGPYDFEPKVDSLILRSDDVEENLHFKPHISSFDSCIGWVKADSVEDSISYLKAQFPNFVILISKDELRDYFTIRALENVRS